MRFLFLIFSITVLGVLTGCTGVPKGVKPVRGFEADRYLGRWYEVARLDHSFERGLSHVTAEYTRNDDGTINVVNRGYDAKKGRFKTATAKAEFLWDDSIGSLGVTFQWPFTGGYHVIALDYDRYDWTMVSGPDKSYLWVLSREPELDQEVLDQLVAKADRLGYPVDELIYVEQVVEEEVPEEE